MIRKLKIMVLSLFCFSSGYALNNTDSLDIKIGQMLLMGVSNDTMYYESNLINRSIRNQTVGGILLYEKNIAKKESRDKLKAMIDSIQNLSSIPLFISIDQEGGRVNRLKPIYGFPHMASAYYIGTQNNIDTTKYYGNITAKTLSELGINLNFAPVLDIHNPVCPVLGRVERCYSTDMLDITKHAYLIIESHKQHNVLTAVKHFPGHGNSRTDTHYGIADVTNYWLEEELDPYKTLIDIDMVDMIMTAHVVNGNLDANLLPATLSKSIITGLLRDRLNYQGVVISDDMQMDAISNYFDLRNSIKMAINAGIDILMFSNNSYNQSQNSVLADVVVQYIKDMVTSGEISQERINESFKRIQLLKNKMSLIESLKLSESN